MRAGFIVLQNLGVCLDTGINQNKGAEITMKKTIGILGGISLASTIQYYKLITDLYYEQYKDYYYPEINIKSLDFQYFTDLENERRTNEYIDYIVKGLFSLKNAGSDFVIMAANSPHSVYPQVAERVDIPMISIVDTAAKKAAEFNLKKVLLTGIKYTMQGSFYQNGFKKYNIQVITPNESHQDKINNIIFKELVIHKISDATRSRVLEIINSYDVDGVILGCTELPLLLQQKHSHLKLLDTLTLHAIAALDFSLAPENDIINI